MEIIKFSHNYRKLRNDFGETITEARLLDVIVVNKNELSKYFLAYDTDQGKYKLQNTDKFLMLIFLKPRETMQSKNFEKGFQLFTTLRTCWHEKDRYYRRHIGDVFKIDLTASDDKNPLQID